MTSATCSQNLASRHCKATSPAVSKAVPKQCLLLDRAHFHVCCTVTATGQTGDPLSQPHTNISCVRKRSTGGKVSRRGRGATRGLHHPAGCRARGAWGAPLVLCKLAGEKQTTLTQAWLWDCWCFWGWLGKAQQGLPKSISNHRGHPSHQGSEQPARMHTLMQQHGTRQQMCCTCDSFEWCFPFPS